MPAEDHFISRGLLKVRINDFLSRELRRAGYAGVDLQKTPLGMRVVVYASRPGMVIGRRGSTVRALTETLEHEYGLEAPQIEVSEIEVPELNGSIMAELLAQRLERGDHFRRAAYGVLRRIIGAGATGVEISIKGKLTSRRARYQKFRSGFVAKTGEPVRTNVSHGIAYAILKPGILGVQVRIMLPDAVVPDRPTIQHREVAVEAVPADEEAEIEIIEEEISLEEAPPLEEVTEEAEPTTEVSSEPAASTEEPEVIAEKTLIEEVPPKPEPEIKKKKPKAPPAKPKVKPKKKVVKKEEAKPKAKPKAEPKKKPEVKPKAKPKAKVKEKKPAKPKAKAKPKVKKEEKPKAKAKSKTKEKAKPKPKAKPKTKAAEGKSKKPSSKAKKPTQKVTKKSSKS